MAAAVVSAAAAVAVVIGRRRRGDSSDDGRDSWSCDCGEAYLVSGLDQAHAAGIAQSVGRGDCYNNAVAESFFATLKRERASGRDARPANSCSAA